MGALFLVIWACSAQGRPCNEYNYMLQDISLLTCTMVASQIIVEWQLEHPYLVPKKWTCTYSRGQKV